MKELGVSFALAVVVEGIMEWLGAPIPERYKPYVAAALGIVLALVYGADILDAVAGWEATVPYAGQILTGALIGRGSNYLNEFFSLMKVTRKNNA